MERKHLIHSLSQHNLLAIIVLSTACSLVINSAPVQAVNEKLNTAHLNPAYSLTQPGFAQKPLAELAQKPLAELSKKPLNSGAVGVLHYTKKFKGYAYDLKNGNLLYTETHSRQNNNQLSTDYNDPEGNLIADRAIQFNHGVVSRFEFNSRRSDFFIKIDRSQQSLLFKRINKKVKKNGLVVINHSVPSVIDAGFNRFVVRHWNEILQSPKTFNFFHTGKAGWLKLKIESTGETQINGYSGQQFKLTLASPIFAAFIKPIKLSYYSDIRELGRYEGVSNIKSVLGSNQRVRIEFPRGEFNYSRIANNGTEG